MKIISLAIVVCSVIPHVLAQSSIGTGSIKELYVQNCASCHGQNMEGGLGVSLIDDVWKHGGSDEDIARVIRDGVPDLGMVAWKGVLSEEQIRGLIILIREQKLLAESGAILQKAKPLNGIFSTELHNFRLEKVTEIDGLIWSMAFLPDGSMLLTQRSGILWHFSDGELTPIEGIPEAWVYGQGGLLEVALHPDFKDNGWVYLTFAEHAGVMVGEKPAGMTAVVRGRIRGNKWVDEEEIFRAPEQYHIASTGHFGSRIAFKDGYIYFSIGERTKGEMAQDITRPNGKVHRLHDDGRIPTDNPFYDTPGACQSIWSYGSRNPQGLAIEPQTGELWETEHGPRGGDELNLIRRGANYGWPVITYGMRYNGEPLTDKTHQEGMEQPAHYWVPSIAVCGIDFYEGDAFPGWKHDLLVSGMSAQELQRITIKDGEVTGVETILKNQGRVRDVASGPDGKIYVALNVRDPNHGELYRMEPVGVPHWESLFNGYDLDGWKVLDGNSTVLVDDGAMVALHQGTDSHTYLTTEKRYGDFILELDVKVIGNLNSGIVLRGIQDPEIKEGKVHGYQMEIDQSERQWTGGIFEEMGRGWLYSLEGKVEARAAYRNSDWNHYRIELIGDRFRIWVNGVPTTNMVDGRVSEGVIAFQIHKLPEKGGGGAVYIRNPRIIDRGALEQIRSLTIPEFVVK